MQRRLAFIYEQMYCGVFNTTTIHLSLKLRGMAIVFQICGPALRTLRKFSLTPQALLHLHQHRTQQ